MVFDIPDTSSMLNDMTTLTDAIGALDEGVGKLKNGVGDMKGGIASLASGSADLNAGLTLLSGNSTSLTAASSQINDALAEIAKQLGSGAVDPAQITELIGGLRKLSAGLSSGGDMSQPGLAEGLGQVQGGITQATTVMDGLIGGLAPVTDQGEIGALMGELGALSLSSDSQLTLEKLLNTNKQAAIVQGAWWYGPNGNDGVKAGLESAAAGLTQSIGGCQYMAGQLTAIADGLEAGLGGMAQLQTLATVMDGLSTSYSAFNDGLVVYAGGVNTLAANYKTFNSGLSQLVGGVNDLYGGVSELRDGTVKLHANVEDLPATMQKEIDSFLSDYQKNDFTPVSFVSAKNEHVKLTQFVLITDPVEIPAPADENPTPEPTTKTLWDRLMALFT
jgi:X-X-X-Leu-X-X-Gly heptad repeat protein